MLCSGEYLIRNGNCCGLDDDPYSVVRYVSYRSLKKLPGYQEFSYDFTAPKGTQRQAKNQALELWKSQAHVPFGDSAPALLLDAQGELNATAAEELYRKRNNRRVKILE